MFEGERYILAQGPALPAGAALAVTVSGLPHHSPWPRRIALTLAILMLGGRVLGGGAAAVARSERREGQTAQRQTRENLQRARPARAAAARGQHRRGKICRAPARADGAARARVSRSRRRGGPERRRVSADFLDLSIRELSRNFGRRRALIARVARLPQPARSSACSGRTAQANQRCSRSSRRSPPPRRAACCTAAAPREKSAPPVRSRIGVLSHDLHLYSELTALENLVFFGRLYGVANAGDCGRRRAAPRAARRARRRPRVGFLARHASTAGARARAAA